MVYGGAGAGGQAESTLITMLTVLSTPLPGKFHLHPSRPSLDAPLYSRDRAPPPVPATNWACTEFGLHIREVLTCLYPLPGLSVCLPLQALALGSALLSHLTASAGAGTEWALGKCLLSEEVSA